MATSRDRVDWRTPTIYLVVAAAVMGPMDTPLISPVLPGAQAALELTDAQVGLFITALALPGVVSAPLIGMAADRYGRTEILVGCLTIYGLAGAAVALVSTFPAVLALRFVQGVVGSSILEALAMTLVGDLYTGRRETQPWASWVGRPPSQWQSIPPSAGFSPTSAGNSPSTCTVSAPCSRWGSSATGSGSWVPASPRTPH
jgi:MFS family permease